jgi:hypothetical protein
MKGEPVYCYYCGIKVDEEARYCSHCGGLLLLDKNGSGATPPDRENTGDSLLVRIHILGTGGDLTGGFFVAEGEEAFLGTGGPFPTVMGPGQYSREWFRNKLDGQNAMVGVTVVRKGNVELAFKLENLRTGDPVTIDVMTSLIVHIENPILFVENITQGSKAYRASELCDYLRDAVHNAFSHLLRERSVKELGRDGSSSERKKMLEVLVEHQLKSIFETNGLYLDQIKSVEYDFRHFNRVMETEEEGFLGSEKDVAEAEALEKRIAARRKTLDLMGDLSLSDEQVEDFVLESEKSKLLRERELQDIKTALAEKEVDHKIKRDFIVRKLELDQELDYERRRLLGKAGIDREVAEARYAVMEVETGLHRIDLENEIYSLKAKGAAEIEISAQKDESSLKTMHALVELKAKKDRDAIENELFREKERLELRLREKEREAGIERRIYLRCLNPDCKAAFSIKAEGTASPYQCPKCAGNLIEYA